MGGRMSDKLREYKKLLFMIIAPFIIGAWCVMNPRKVWEQAKKDWG
jgi:hypothetical protein